VHDTQLSTKPGAPSNPLQEKREADWVGDQKAQSINEPLAPGLYLVATPIGNLGDITLRALDVLRRADRIACEDTRQTQKLLNHFQIDTPTISCHEHNERDRAHELVAALRSGARIALVSDAGTPAISDPGGWLTRAAIDAGIPVIPIPGPSAALSALVASGLPATEFHFLGFLPEKAGARRTLLEDRARQPRSSAATLIFYEAPHRILETLADFESAWGPDARIVLARELTKFHEEFLRGTIAELRTTLAARDRIRGEIVLLLEAPTRSASSAAGAPASESLAARIARLQSEEGIDEKEALKKLARESGQSKSELYRELQRQRARRR
jgi:16S rRNA (cytidine1402-2'-O)-methyltransferase